LVETYTVQLKKKKAAFSETEDLEQVLHLPYQSETVGFALVMVAAGAGARSRCVVLTLGV